ncbi:hypothetical protein AB0442_28545, partial [Kitasatospora sp. NPDC085895]|uniref:hypothetical protein n=1 Tax=Kitasatospora sp. NPDC085895 TaxID=3155057 RepID=UPI003450EE82
MTDNQDFDALLEQSSLGSAGARRLRARTPVEHAAAVRITMLRRAVAAGDDSVLGNLARLLEQAGVRGEAMKL